MKGQLSSGLKRGTAALCLVAVVAMVVAPPAAAAPYTPYTPSNSFSFGTVKLHQDKGTATLTVDVPGPGKLTLTGNGVVKQRPAALRLRNDKIVAAAGKVTLKVKAKGSAKRKLNKTGKAKVKVKVTFKPTGGTAKTKTKRITLKKLASSALPGGQKKARAMAGQ